MVSIQSVPEPIKGIGSAGTGSWPDALAIGDLNGDGKPDLAVAHDTFGDVSILSALSLSSK